MKFNCRFLPPIFWAILIFFASSNSDPLFFLSLEGVHFLKRTRFLGQSLLNLTWAMGHVFVYAVLAFLVVRALAHHLDYLPRLFWIAFAVTLLYGISDEIHQVFVPGRGFQYLDILMDGVGALIGLGVYASLRLIQAQKDREEALLL